MIRTLKRYIATDGNDNKEYVELSMLSTDTKPTTGIINGSIVNEVDTGKVFFFNETAGQWEEEFSFQDIGGGGGSGLPPVTDADNGKVLGVEDGEWSPVDAPSGLPDVTASDNGKVLTVENGAWAAKKAILLTLTPYDPSYPIDGTWSGATDAELEAAWTNGTPIRIDVFGTRQTITSREQNGNDIIYSATFLCFGSILDSSRWTLFKARVRRGGQFDIAYYFASY